MNFGYLRNLLFRMQPESIVIDLFFLLNQPNNISGVCCCYLKILFVSGYCSLILYQKDYTKPTLYGMYEKSNLHVFVFMHIWPFKNSSELLL